MGQLLLLLIVVLTVAAVVVGVTVLVNDNDPGLTPVEPDDRAVPLPANRPLQEQDVARARFDIALRGYRMAQVDQALRRAAYDIGYKDELIGVLHAEIAALREGRPAEADALRRAREDAAEAGGTGGRPADATAAAPLPADPLPTDPLSTDPVPITPRPGGPGSGSAETPGPQRLPRAGDVAAEHR